MSAWVLKDGLQNEAALKSVILASHKVFAHNGDEASQAKALLDAAKWGCGMHDAKLKDDTKDCMQEPMIKVTMQQLETAAKDWGNE